MHIQNQNLHKEAPVRRREDDELTAKGKFPSHFPHWNVCGSRPRQRLSRRHSRNPGRLRIRRPVRTPDSNQGIQAQRQHLLGTTRRKPSSVRPTAGGTLEQKRGQQGSGERVTRRWRSSRPRRRGGGGGGDGEELIRLPDLRRGRDPDRRRSRRPIPRRGRAFRAPLTSRRGASRTCPSLRRPCSSPPPLPAPDPLLLLPKSQEVATGYKLIFKITYVRRPLPYQS